MLHSEGCLEFNSMAVHNSCLSHLLHLLKGLGGGHGGGGLLDDLLVPPLDGAVPPKQGDGVAILVGQDLHLQVAGVLRQLHDEDRGAGDLSLDLGGTTRH